MDCSSNIFITLLLLTLSTFFLLLHRRHKSSSRNSLPPGPPGWPIFGNLFDLGSMPHRNLANMRQKYGPVVWLRLGAMNSLVILSAKTAGEFFKNHDRSFADRMVTETMRAHDYDQGSLALAPYGSYWRVLRRLVTVDMLVNKRINETVPVRRTCVDQMLEWIEKESRDKFGKPVAIHVGKFVFFTAFNLLGNLMLSRDVIDPESREGSELFTAILRLMEWTGNTNMADFFPIFKSLDPQRLKRNMERDLGKALDIANKYVKERMEERASRNELVRRKDFLDVLLDFQGNGRDEPEKLSERDVNVFILEIFIAGSETTSGTVEWAVTELLLNPESLTTAKAELAQVIGANRRVQESDIENLPYLQAVIKETLRLHPPIPFLIPRRAVQDTDFMGYFIPKNTQVLVNAWAIGRDPDAWEEPFIFKPERFIGSDVDFKGQHYELMPFGAGRRMCAGVPLASRALHLVVGSLLHEFDWELEAGFDRATMDMNEKIGVTSRKSEPLLAVPKKCRVLEIK
ncbi:hypothetical protein K2173_018582 [Erythroxylum novogranatense]|uniref:Cytochrome P450 n=1 Tax=Erythroxylum novogranatense TaxID=1862640 RepID=A0AAV8UDI5_9ROSI|nr:hypothetical protein K2173_018582 [Erythroxylum novogranatense]